MVPLAFTSPNGIAGNRPELQQSNGLPRASELVAVAPFAPGALLAANDGTVSPISRTLLAAPHAPGLYLWSAYLNVAVAAAAGGQIDLQWGDLQGPQTLGGYYPLPFGTPGIVVLIPYPLPIFSAGLLPIVAVFTFGGAVGPPLLFDVCTSVALVG